MKTAVNKIYNPEIECMPRENLRELQNERLQKTVRLVYDKVEVYRKRMDEKASSLKILKRLTICIFCPLRKRRICEIISPTAYLLRI